MSAPGVKRATYDDVLAAPEHLIAEVIDGVLMMSPRPAFGHARASTLIGATLTTIFDRRSSDADGRDGWWILYEPELHLGEDILVPDIAGWRRDRLPVLPRAPFGTLAPDWLCEVLSPGSVRTDRVRKMAIWAREGVRNVWLVDPDTRILEVYRLVSGLLALVAAFDGDSPARAEPFDAVELDLQSWWL
jgi:Uma2 family endonuclease